jgi:hypothetical protein
LNNDFECVLEPRKPWLQRGVPKTATQPNI